IDAKSFLEIYSKEGVLPSLKASHGQLVEKIDQSIDREYSLVPNLLKELQSNIEGTALYGSFLNLKDLLDEFETEEAQTLIAKMRQQLANDNGQPT
ncbi:MAG: hypothetical protein HQL68_13245, partial [Magnetococcales bacterium]|nr:hypothetical protein [Magnetococcales bacterium]